MPKSSSASPRRSGGLIAAVKARGDVQLVAVAVGSRDGLPEELEAGARDRLAS